MSELNTINDIVLLYASDYDQLREYEGKIIEVDGQEIIYHKTWDDAGKYIVVRDESIDPAAGSTAIFDEFGRLHAAQVSLDNQETPDTAVVNKGVISALRTNLQENIDTVASRVTATEGAIVVINGEGAGSIKQAVKTETDRAEAVEAGLAANIETVENLIDKLNLEPGAGENSIQQKQSSKNISYVNDYYSFEEAPTPGAIGKDSFEANGNSAALGELSFASGRGTATIAARSHTEGTNTIANGINSHAEGGGTYTGAEDAHAEGMYTHAEGIASHAEGFRTGAIGVRSHAEGAQTAANGQASHAEGASTTVDGFAGHAEGSGTVSSGEGAHAEGYYTEASGLASHAEGGYTEANGIESHAEGRATKATGANTHAEGQETEAYGDNSHTEGYQTKTYGDFGHTEGWQTYTGKQEFELDRANIDKPTPPAPPVPSGIRYILKDNIDAIPKSVNGDFQIINNETIFHYIVVGINTAGETVVNYQVNPSWAPGDIQVYKNAWLSSAYKTVYDQSPIDASLTTWLIENKREDTPPQVIYSAAGHAEGIKTQAVGPCSHAEGQATLASGSCSHAEGWLNEANGDYSHAEGKYTTANGYAQHVEGRYNQQRGDDVLHIVGNGTDKDHLSNAFEVFADGHAEVKSAGNTPNSVVRKSDLGETGKKYLHKVVGNLEVGASNDPHGTFFIINNSSALINTTEKFKANASHIISFSAGGNGDSVGILVQYEAHYSRYYNNGSVYEVNSGYDDAQAGVITDTVIEI